MYCPNCATQNIEGGKFCRKCGANLSLVPQALSGHLPQAPGSTVEEAITGRIEEVISRRVARAVRRSLMGLAFLIVFAALFFSRRAPGFGEVWLLIPAFILLGRGVGELVTQMISRSRENRKATPVEKTSQLPPPAVYDPLAPPSVTERTTRHLEAVEQERQRVS